MLSNRFHFMLQIGLAVGLGLTAAGQLRADDQCKNACPKGGTVCRNVCDIIEKCGEKCDGGLILHLTITTENEQGVPILDKVPYVSRLFKNTGTEHAQKTLVISVGDAEPLNRVDNPPRQINALIDDIQQFAFGEIGLCAAKCEKSCDTECKASKCDSKCAPAACQVVAIEASDCKPVGCKKACKASGCKPAAGKLAGCQPDHKEKLKKVAQKKPAGNACQCDACHCSKSESAVAKKLQKKLLQVMAENAELRVLAEAQEAIAEAKQEFLIELMEAKVELARLHAAHAGAGLARHPQPHRQPHANIDDHSNVIEHLTRENDALKRRVAELERHTRQLR